MMVSSEFDVVVKHEKIYHCSYVNIALFFFFYMLQREDEIKQPAPKNIKAYIFIG